MLKRAVYKAEMYLNLMDIGEKERLDFSTALTKVKREIDIQLSTFKEKIDLEANKKIAELHESLLKSQEDRLVNEISNL